MIRINDNKIDLDTEDLVDARKHLTDEEAVAFDRVVRRAGDRAKFYSLTREQRYQRQILLRKAFPDKDVAPIDIRRWAVQEAHAGTNGIEEVTGNAETEKGDRTE